MHPTVKPVALVEDAFKDVSKRKGIALDPFCGSGTTIIAAEKTGRRARAVELEPKYVDVAVRRWERYTGKTAVLEATGRTFEEAEQERHPANDSAAGAEAAAMTPQPWRSTAGPRLST
jgi:methylase of polypeptide subunit release factors